MARPKQFDPDEALESALKCFKQHGYAAASMSTLTEAMGIGRASIYATYGDKRSLYFAALTNYADATVGYVSQRLEQSESPLEDIRALLRDVAHMAGSREFRHGCFLVNSTAELAATDEDVRAFVTRSFGRLEQAFYLGLCRAKDRGELDGAKQPRALARFLVAQMQCLRVIGKTGPDAETLEDIVETALTCIA